MCDATEKPWAPIPNEAIVDFQGEKGPYDLSFRLELECSIREGKAIAWSGIRVITPSPIGTIDLYFQYWNAEEAYGDLHSENRTLTTQHLTEILNTVTTHPAVQTFKQVGEIYFAALPHSCLAHREGFPQSIEYDIQMFFDGSWEPQPYVCLCIGGVSWEEDWPFTSEDAAREAMAADYKHEGLEPPTEWPPRCAGESCSCHQVPPRSIDDPIH